MLSWNIGFHARDCAGSICDGAVGVVDKHLDWSVSHAEDLDRQGTASQDHVGGPLPVLGLRRALIARGDDG